MCVVLRMGVIVMAVVAGCATAPKSVGEQDGLTRDAEYTLSTMKSRDPALADVLATSAGYVLVPSIGKGGVVVAGAFGRGVLFEHGQRVGFVKVTQANFGAVLGGQKFAELLVLKTPFDITELKNGDFKIGANVGAIAVRQGAARSATFDTGSAAFVMPLGGAMVDVSVDGQSFRYEHNAG